MRKSKQKGGARTIVVHDRSAGGLSLNKVATSLQTAGWQTSTACGQRRLICSGVVRSLISVKVVYPMILALAALFVAMPTLNLSVYASPLAIAFAGLIFYACSKLQINNKLFVRLITLLAPSMFTVYLIHSHLFGFTAMARFEDWFLAMGGGMILCYFATATLVFLIGVVSDIPRRALTGLISFLCSSDRRMVLR